MANETNKLAAAVRTETGKGAARRARRTGNVPAVLYGHGTEARPLSLPTLELATILRNNGTNAIVELDIDGESQLALTKQVDVHPTKNYIEHVDLLVVKKGEKLTVEVVVVVEGDAAPGTLVTQDANTIEVEADAMSIPEQILVSVEGAEVGHSVTAADLQLPAGATVLTDPETLIVAVNAAPTAAQLEAEIDAEGAGVEEDAPESADDAEGDSNE